MALASAAPQWPVAAIAGGALAGLFLCRGVAAPGPSPLALVSRPTGVACLAGFTALLLAPGLFGAFYHSGALVFGGGHVVLPLLREAVVTSGWVSEDAFLAGYGAAQAMPGPLFTFATYLGALLGPFSAVATLLAIFLPGFLLLVGVLPFWGALRVRPGAQAAMRGANAAVVGVLPRRSTTRCGRARCTARVDFVAAAAGFVLLTAWRAPPLAIVALGAAAGLLGG